MSFLFRKTQSLLGVMFVWYMVGAPVALSAKPVDIAIAFRFDEAGGAGYVNSFVQGFDLAAQEFEKAHPQEKVRWVRFSYPTDDLQIEAIGRKIAKDGFDFVIGGETSDETKALAKGLGKDGPLLITPTATDPRVNSGPATVFQISHSDEQTTKRLSGFWLDRVAKRAEKTKLVVVQNEANGYSEYLGNQFAKNIEEGIFSRGLKKQVALTRTRFNDFALTFDAAVAKMKDDKVTDVALLTGRDDFYKFLDTAKRLKFSPRYWGSDGWGTPQAVTEGLGKRSLLGDFDGILTTYWNDSEDPRYARPAVRQFKDRFKARYQKSPDAWAAIAYDSAWVLLNAIQRAPKKTPKEVAAELHARVFENTVTAPKIKFNQKNSAEKDLYLYEIKASRAEFLDSI